MPSKISAVRADTLRRQVEDAVRQAITSGKYAPGERLIERELCEGLGVSRTSLREALRKLEAEKLVKIVPHKGPMVAVVTPEEARELYEMRGLLEGFAAREFALHASDSAVAQFRKTAKSLRTAAEAGNTDKVLSAKGRLYDIMLVNCGNSLLSEVLHSLFSRINLLRATSLMHPERLPHSLAEIDELAGAFEVRDADKAQTLAARHVANAYQVALTMLGERDRQQ
ncbi:GntR family transcriptional regulator [Salinisphaera sp. T5B8]|uniref:GntR family transcriptional regulator n=1 Tax=Salinisphaera sp. T5B8 TaxID=1304154 RepID=UPI003341BC83